MNAVDTNVLLYVHDPRDVRKQAIAQALVQSINDGALLWQVACEYLSASRKLEPLGFRSDDAWNDLQQLLQVWTPVLPQFQHLDVARTLVATHSLSFWDALILAVAIESSVTTIYSEDLCSVGNIPGIQLLNPFAP